MQNKIDIAKVATGIYWINIPEANIKILCGCPADTVKHLKKRGLIDIIEQDNLTYETGPNAILLADILVQNGQISNLAEFPLLQMLYSQGMLIPNHPNNTGEKPLLMGSPTQIKAQMEYFYRGNYGLISKEEIAATGVSQELVETILDMKLKFAFGKLHPSKDLVDQLILPEEDRIEIKNGAYIRRKDKSIFEISYEDESVVVDLNLKHKEAYEPPYYLGFHKLDREYFSIIHTGEGNAWDVNRPCMASIITFQGKVYLIDAGPDLLTSLDALGVTVNEVEGIFHTHAHDDHFAGLMSFVRSDHRIKYFASPIVRASVCKKLCALMSVGEESFYNFFDVQDLALDEWNNIDGLEVMPVLSPHPVETNIYYFRAFWGSQYRTYAHLADVASFDILEDKIFKTTAEKNYDAILEKTKKAYLFKADVKKIDVGGGLVHGQTKDYIEDQSTKILLAHLNRNLKDEEKQVGSFAPFGSVDALADTHQDFLRIFAYKYLLFYFPEVPDYELQALLNCPIVTMNAGDTLFKKGTKYEYVYLLLTGAVELIYPDIEFENSLSAGSLIGFYLDEDQLIAQATCRASYYINTLKIPADLYLMLVKKYKLVEPFNQLEKTVLTLARTWLFSENISLPVYIKIAQIGKEHTFKKGQHFELEEKSNLFLIKAGQAALSTADNHVIENLRAGDFFGADNRFNHADSKFEAFFLEDTILFEISMDTILNIPIVYWKLLEISEKRSDILKKKI